MKKKLLVKNTVFILLILLLAFFLRFYRISQAPASLDWDEVAIGWNAHTIFHSRRDEFGTRLPLVFRSFGDYKSPFLIYLTAPFVGFFGMNEFSVRFPSAFFGSLSILVFYFLIKELFKKRKLKIGLIASFLLAINPWHLQFSRPAFEPNSALFFILLGTWLFFKAINSRPFYLLLSSLAFVFSLYSYHSPKIFLPLFFIGLFVLYRKKLLQIKGWLLGSILLAGILLWPLAKIHLFEQGSARLQGSSVFYTEKGEKRPMDLELGKKIVRNYLVHFSPQFLFFGNPDNPRIKMKEMGLLYWVEAPFLLFGLYLLIKQRRDKWAKFLLFWLIIGPVPAMIGRDTPHSIRAFNILPALITTIAIGVDGAFQKLRDKRKKRMKSFYYLLIGLFIFNFAYYFYTYHWKYSVATAKDWQYGYKELAHYLRDEEDKVEKIIVTSAYGQPHIFIQFWQERKVENVFWGGMKKYLYRDVNWEEDQRMENTLIVGTPEQIPLAAIPRWTKIEKEIYFPDGSVAFRIMRR